MPFPRLQLFFRSTLKPRTGTWTPEVCRIAALDRFWAINLLLGVEVSTIQSEFSVRECAGAQEGRCVFPATSARAG